MPQVSINATASGDNTLVDLETGDRAIISDLVLTAAGAVVAILKDEAANELGRYTFGAAGDQVSCPAIQAHTTGDILLNLSGEVAVTGHLYYGTRAG